MEYKTKTEELIETLLRELDPATPRYQVLVSARQFKSSWVELGEKLTRVLREKLFQNWGYNNFEDYCRKEIRIRQATAEKLTLAFGYLERQQPTLLGSRDQNRELPDYRSVDLLRRVDEDPSMDETQKADLKRAVFEERRSLPNVRRQYQEMVREQNSEEDDRKKWLTALRATQRLIGCLEELDETNETLVSELRRLHASLEARLGETTDS